MTQATAFTAEIERTQRLSDQLCTIHAWLRDRYDHRAFVLDCVTMVFSIWLIAVVFVEPVMGQKLTPFDWNTQIWLGLLSICSFFLTIFQFMNGWKSRAQAHHRSCEIYADVKSECRRSATLAHLITTEDIQRIRAKYDTASKVGTHINEGDFLKGKRRHKLKVYISDYLDENPGVWVSWLKIRVFLRDNCGISLLKPLKSDGRKPKKKKRS